MIDEDGLLAYPLGGDEFSLVICGAHEGLRSIL